MYFIGNACFRRKIVYHNKMHLHYPSLNKRLAPTSINPQTQVFKKVRATALDYAQVFLILTRVFSLQKSRLVFYDIIYVIIYEIIYFTFFMLIMNGMNKPQLFVVLNTKIPTCFFTSNSASVFLNFSSVQCQMLLRCYLIYINICVYIGKIVYLSF